MSENALEHPGWLLMNSDSVILRSLFSLSAKVYVALSALALSAVVTRVYPSDVAGEFFLAVSLVTIASVFSRFGMDNPVLRYTATLPESGWLLKSFKLALVMFLIVCCLIFVSRALSFFQSPDVYIYLSSVLPFSASVLISQALFGKGKVIWGTIIFGGLAPTFFVFLLFFFRNYAGAAILYALSWWISAIVAVFVACRVGLIVHGRFVISKDDFYEVFPFFLSSIVVVFVQWMPQIFLGLYGFDKEIAYFTAAERASLLISFVLIAVNSVVAPRFARAYNDGNYDVMKSVAHTVCRVSLLAAVPVFSLYVLFPGSVMSLFGPEYRSADSILMIVSVGQLVNVACGSVFTLMAMTGMQGKMLTAVGFSALIGGMMNTYFIPVYGYASVSVVYSIVLILQNITGLYYVKRKLGFWSFG